MSALLDIVSEAADMRRAVEAEFLKAVRRAHDEGRHTGTEIAKAAGLSKQRISQILRGANEDE